MTHDHTRGIPPRRVFKLVADGDRAEAQLWLSLSYQLQMKRINDADRARWITADAALSGLVIDHLRSGDWTAEGVQEGQIVPEVIPPGWWQRPVSLDLWNATAEWNGVRVAGLLLFPGAPVSADQETVTTWMQAYYQRARDAGRPAPKRELDAFPACKAATGATALQLKAAMRAVPAELKRQRGDRDQTQADRTANRTRASAVR